MNSVPVLPQWTAWIQQIFGGGLVLTGGIVAQGMKVRFDKKEEIECIKVSLSDEINGICDIIGRMSETHRTTGNVVQTYFNELSENDGSFKFYRPRLFLLKDTQLRRSICDFYKKLKNLIDQYRDGVGSLNKQDDAQKSKENGVITKLQAFATEAEALEKRITAYAYRPLYIF